MVLTPWPPLHSAHGPHAVVPSSCPDGPHALAPSSSRHGPHPLARSASALVLTPWRALLRRWSSPPGPLFCPAMLLTPFAPSSPPIVFPSSPPFLPVRWSSPPGPLCFGVGLHPLAPSSVRRWSSAPGLPLLPRRSSPPGPLSIPCDGPHPL